MDKADLTAEEIRARLEAGEVLFLCEPTARGRILRVDTDKGTARVVFIGSFTGVELPYPIGAGATVQVAVKVEEG
ncbi:hypothetical protein ACIBI0_38555 [Microbispora rosea]|uniref:hypothetical protein n=1 Tax=Microbispora rosea TaxID=58117 RepID=UPI0037A26373